MQLREVPASSGGSGRVRCRFRQVPDEVPGRVPAGSGRAPESSGGRFLRFGEVPAQVPQEVPDRLVSAQVLKRLRSGRFRSQEVPGRFRTGSGRFREVSVQVLKVPGGSSEGSLKVPVAGADFMLRALCSMIHAWCFRFHAACFRIPAACLKVYASEYTIRVLCLLT